MNIETKHAVGALAIRLSLGLIFLISGIGKLFLGLAPPLDKVLPFIPLHISTYLLGLLELIVGIMLLIGLFTRIAAWVAAALFITFLISGAALGLFMQAGLLKDVGLLAAAISTALIGCAKWGLDCAFVRKRVTTEGA